MKNVFWWIKYNDNLPLNLPFSLQIDHFCRHFWPFQAAIPFQIDEATSNCNGLFHAIGKVNCGFVRLNNLLNCIINKRLGFFGLCPHIKLKFMVYLFSHWRQIPNVAYQRPWSHHLEQIFKITLFTRIPECITKTWIVFHCNWIDGGINLNWWKKWINLKIWIGNLMEIFPFSSNFGYFWG